MSRLRDFALLSLFLIPIPFAYPSDPTAGMFNVYFALDEAMGYREVRDDISEVYKSGITLFHHYFQDEYARDIDGTRFWSGLPGWLSRNPTKKRELDGLKGKFGSRLGWRLFFWRYYLREVKRQTKGGGKVIIGEMYAMFALRRWWDELERFVEELCRFESEIYPGGIAGWYVAEEPNSPRKRYNPSLYEELIRRIREAERKGGWRRHDIYVDISPSNPPKRVIPFVRNADVVMISPDAYIWAAGRPRDMSRYDRIPLAIWRMRSHLARAKNERAKIHIALQAYQSPTNLQMHQQIKLALLGGWFMRGRFRIPVSPPDGIWLWWWHDCKSVKVRHRRINRWDLNTEYAWSEAVSSELSHPKDKTVRLEGKHRWRRNVYLIGDLLVPKGSRLIIDPGVKVRFSPLDRFGGGADPRRCELIIEGELTAKGTRSKPIQFLSGANVRDFFYPPRNPAKGDWYGIRVPGGRVLMENYIIRDALHEEIVRLEGVSE
ncbi:TPA: hypothetical protein EYP37_03335 [Candidatus Poribacteria bacterium]|nr:hypothetical protein [Candidatus Poribacteria bacterium]